MIRDIFLEKGKSKFSVNAETNLNVNLSAKTRLLPYNDVDETMNLYDLYKDEIDSCNKFRFIFTVNPICSNALFNARTEVIRHEGSDDVTVLLGELSGDTGTAINTTNLTIKQAIKDTEYTFPELFKDGEPYVYHCGWDIMNNHLLRAKEFVNVTTAKTTNGVFNTIEDYQRNFSGETITEDISINVTGVPPTEMHLYRFDSVNTMYDAFSEKTEVENGWYGFTNKMNMLIPNYSGRDGDAFCINRVMNNNKACEFIDYYPDRSLYSFIPKVNKYRQRLEYNWDYCITYPYKNDYDTLCEVVGSPMFNGSPAMKIISSEVYGNGYVRFKTMMRHALVEGDYVTIFSNDKKVGSRARVIGIGEMNGNEANHYFSVKFYDISSEFTIDTNGELVSKTDDDFVLYYKKNVNGYECEYYFRKFKHLYRPDGNEFNNQVSKLAYGENIYGDRVAQLIYTDDIDTSGLKDNRGRHLSELYLTMVKANRGYKEWYEDNNFSDPSVEFSHCFGKVTDGIDMGLDDDCIDYNVRRLHNINYDELLNDAETEIFEGAFHVDDNGDIRGAKSISDSEDGITINDDEFFGDIVEFDPVNCVETIIENVYFRFNTAQRETTNSKYSEIWYDRFDRDDYDQEIQGQGFKVTEINVSVLKGENAEIPFHGNLNPEGYFYNPHNRVKIRELADDVSRAEGILLHYSNEKIEDKDKKGSIEYKVFNSDEPVNMDTYTVNLTIDMKLIRYDDVAIYDVDTRKIIWSFVERYDSGGDGEMPTLTLCVDSNNELDMDKLNGRRYYLIVSKDYVPEYATYLTNSRSFVWRDTIAPSQLTSDSELKTMPFTNGRLYVEQNIDMFVKRQDPRNEYRMLSPEKVEGAKYTNPLKGYMVWGWDNIDFDVVKYFAAAAMSICK